jgi:16S rRNA processing protein RimM
MQLIPIGEIVSAHGLKGGFKVYIYNTKDPIIYKLESVYIGDKDNYRQCKIKRVKKVSERMCIVSLDEVCCREEAECLKRRLLMITPEMLPPIEEGYVYISLLIGSCVFDQDMKELGIVEDFIDTGAQLLMVVRHINGSEFMVPYVDEFIREIDQEKKQIIINVIEGLIE